MRESGRSANKIQRTRSRRRARGTFAAATGTLRARGSTGAICGARAVSGASARSTGAICGVRAVSGASPRSTGAICGARAPSGDSPRSFGTILRSGSGIAALSRHRAGVALLDQPPQVFLNEGELRNHLLDALAFDAGKGAGHGLLAERRE